MKRIITTGICFALLTLLLAACYDSLSPDNKGSGDPGGLVVNLYKLNLSSSELATIGGYSLKLTVGKEPKFATLDKVLWTSTGSPKIRVDDEGNITTDEMADGAPPESALIRVESETDPSVYALCSVTIFPDYGSERYWNLGDRTFELLPQAIKDSITQNGMAIPFNVDEDYGQGMVRRGGTGGGSYILPAEAPNGKPLENGLIPVDADRSTYPPYPWVYAIDPAAPYKEGFVPSGGVRGGMTYNNTAQTTSLDPVPTSSDEYSDWQPGSIRTGGLGRIFSIAAIKGPFYIEVRYMSNDASSRWVDLRFGDREGFRAQGSPASGTAASTAIGGIASYTYEKDDVVPFVYVEAQAAVRMMEIIIKYVEQYD
jgi:hypothetical protein